MRAKNRKLNRRLGVARIDALERRVLLSSVTGAAGTNNLVTIEGSPVSGVLATLQDSNPNALADLSASINWGDGSANSAGTVAFNSSTGKFQVSGTHTYKNPLSYFATATITDTLAGMAQTAAKIYVADAPLHPFATTIAASAGKGFTGVVGSFTDSNPNAQLSNYTATIVWGDGHVSLGTIALSAATRRYDVSGTNTYSSGGSYPVSVNIRDTGGMTLKIPSAAGVGGTVTGTNTLTASGGSLVDVEGFPFSGVIASFTDPKPNFTAGFYTASIAWGDGSSGSGTVSYNSTISAFQVTAGHTYKFAGNYHPLVSITSAGGNGSAIAKVYVADAPLHPFATTITPTAGKSFTGVVGSFTDSDSNGKLSYYGATINWGDGHMSAGTISFNNSTGRYDVSGTNAYASGGSYALAVNVGDIGGMTLKINSSAAVSGAIAGVAAHISGASSVNEGNSYSVSFSATDAGHKAISKWVVDWGDGTVVQLAGSATGASHTFADGPASRTVKATATDSVGLSGSASLLVKVNNVAPTATFTGVSPVAANHTSTVQFSSQFDPSPVDTAAGFHYSFDFADNGTFEIVNSTSASATVPAIYLATLGQKTVHGRIIDKDGGFTDYTTTINVISAVLNPFGTTLSLTEGTKFSGVVGSFTNPTPGTTAGNYAATITWGDGHVTSGAIALNASTGRFDVSGSNTYADEGSRAISVQVNAVSGAATTIHSTANVHDPALSASGVSFSRTEGQLFSGAVALFTDGNAAAGAGDFTASIKWGDGSSSAGTVSFNGTAGKWQVAGSHTYRVGGSYSVGVSIKDVGGSSATAGATATIAGAAVFANGLPVTTTMIQDVLAATPQLVATFTSGNALAQAGDFKVSIDWGDATTNPIETIKVVFDSTNNVFDVMATHPYSLINRTYTVTIKISEGNSGSNSTATTFLKII